MRSESRPVPDVLVVGSGNAALCAALSARQAGASVLVLESAPQGEHGGNTAFTAGAMRVPLATKEDLIALVPQLADRHDITFTPYLPEDLIADIQRMSSSRSDKSLLRIIADDGYATLLWMKENGVRFVSHLDRRGVVKGGAVYNPRDAAIRTEGNGQGLIDALMRTCLREGVIFSFDTTAKELIMRRGTVKGVRAVKNEGEFLLWARTVVLACGGFEANPRMRAQFLGPDWDLAKVRGTRFNTGLGLQMAIAAGASPYGNWSGAHAIAQDLNAPQFGEDTGMGEMLGKDLIHLGIIVNKMGQRFMDEGADFRTYTYSTQGHKILKQPDALAFEIFDSKTYPLLDYSYHLPGTAVTKADTIFELANGLGLTAHPLEATIKAFNAAVHVEIPLDHAILDGRGTSGISPPKSNWAQTIDQPPYWGFAVTAGITFTYGGIRINGRAEIVDQNLSPIPNLYAAGEMVGGLFFRNYPGSSGLVSGAVFGRMAGRSAAAQARQITI